MERLVTFEMQDSEGKKLRAGIINSNLSSIPILPTDHQFVLSDAEGNILQTEYFAPQPGGKIKHPLCVTSQFANKLFFHANAYQFGHRYVEWYSVKDKDMVYRGELTSPDFSLGGFLTGDYEFRTFSDTDESEWVTISVYQQLPPEEVEDLKLFAAQTNDNQQIFLSQISSLVNNSVRPIDALLMVKPNATADNYFDWYCLVNNATMILNNRANLMNQTNGAQLSFETRGIALVDSQNIDLIRVFDVTNKQQFITSARPQNGKSSLPLESDRLYCFEGIAGRDVLLTAYCYVPHQSIATKLWEAAKNELADEQNILDELDYLPAEYSQLIGEEKALAIIQFQKNPMFPLINLPEASDGSNEVTVNINNMDLISGLAKTVYVTLQETDLVTKNGYERKLPITTDVASFNKIRYYITPEEQYFLWIQDEQRNLLSDITLYGPGAEDYNDKIRQIGLQEYRRQLTNTFQYLDDKDLDFIAELISYYQSVGEVNKANLHEYLINDLKKSSRTYNFQQSLGLLYEAKLTLTPFRRTFFDGYIYRETQLDKIVFPPKDEPYILQVEKFNIYSDKLEREFVHSGLGAIEYQTRGYDYYILHCIDEKTFERSGYVIVCNIPRKECLKTWNIDIEVI